MSANDCTPPQNIRPECQVMFDYIKKDLFSIRGTLNRLMWWLIGILTMGIVGLIVTVASNGRHVS